MQLIYEYSTRVPLPLNTMQENFKKYMAPLAHIVNETLPEEDDELSKLMVYYGIEKFFIVKEHLPSIQLCNVSRRPEIKSFMTLCIIE